MLTAPGALDWDELMKTIVTDNFEKKKILLVLEKEKSGLIPRDYVRFYGNFDKYKIYISSNFYIIHSY